MCYFQIKSFKVSKFANLRIVEAFCSYWVDFNLKIKDYKFVLTI